MAHSRMPIHTKDSGDQASWEMVDADPGHAANATIPADNEPNDNEPQQNVIDTCPPIDVSTAHPPQQLPNVTSSPAEDAAERQQNIDSDTENPKPPPNAADALILLHVFQSLSAKTGLHSPNAKRIQYFLAGEFVGKPSRVVVAASYELARLSQVYGIADSVRKAADEFRGNMFGPKNITDESQRLEFGREQGSIEAAGPPQKRQRREKAAKPGAAGKVGGLIRPFTVCLFLLLGFVIYVIHVAREHEAQRMHKDELERVDMNLVLCRMELKDANVAWSTLRAKVREAWLDLEASKNHSRFRFFGRR